MSKKRTGLIAKVMPDEVPEFDDEWTDKQLLQLIRAVSNERKARGKATRLGRDKQE